ncbi:protein of unknown function [Candidatus Methylomirabilis oxygeniifera]|uniref:Uncharacterized protein n=1 Tax=Methylomirabilis oxygeniifera TaxID=671143 RepID=D5MK94_METO1|nr:protein of unknown function [Candidatus Methylomirabilis oxyfera]
MCPPIRMSITLIIALIRRYRLFRHTAFHNHQFITTLWVVITTFLLKETLARSLAAQFPFLSKATQPPG